MSGAAEILDWIYSKLGTGFLPFAATKVYDRLTECTSCESGEDKNATQLQCFKAEWVFIP